MKFLCEEPTPVAVTPAYGYIYNLTTGSTVNIVAGQPIKFSLVGIVKGISYVPGSGNIIIENTGRYEVTYFIDTQNGGHFQLKLGATLIPESVYTAKTAAGMRFGQAIIQVNTANSTLQVIAVDNITLTDTASGIVAVNASVFLEKIDEIP